MAANSMIGLVSMISTKLPTMSMLRLMIALVISSKGVARKLSSLTSPSALMRGFDEITSL